MGRWRRAPTTLAAERGPAARRGAIVEARWHAVRRPTGRALQIVTPPTSGRHRRAAVMFAAEVGADERRGRTAPAQAAALRERGDGAVRRRVPAPSRPSWRHLSAVDWSSWSPSERAGTAIVSGRWCRARRCETGVAFLNPLSYLDLLEFGRSTDRDCRAVRSIVKLDLRGGEILVRSIDRKDTLMTAPTTEATARVILDAARTRLLADGYAGLSTRKVALRGRGAVVPGALPLRLQGRHGARPARSREPAPPRPARRRCTPRTLPSGGATSRRATSWRTTSSRATSASSRR